MQNLRDKLLKAGLVSQEEAQKTEAEKQAQAAARPAYRPASPGRDSRPPRNESRNEGSEPRRERPERPRFEPRGRPATREASIPKLPPLPGSKAFQRQEAQRQRELDQALREL